MKSLKFSFEQNAADRMLTGVGHSDHITPVLAHLCWITVCLQLQLKILVLTFKTLYNLGPTHLKNCLLLHEPPDHYGHVWSPCFRQDCLLKLDGCHPRRRPSPPWRHNSRILTPGICLPPFLAIFH